MTDRPSARLKRRSERETLTFEVFDLEFDDDAARRQLAEDPAKFLTDLLAAEGHTNSG